MSLVEDLEIFPCEYNPLVNKIYNLLLHSQCQQSMHRYHEIAIGASSKVSLNFKH